jgi:thiol-disulfide isomerase/thioredoxin
MMNRLMALFLCALLYPVHAVPAPGEAGMAIDFSLPQLHGDVVSVSDYRGKWVVLNYWATWCAPCRKEIPDLSALHKAREDIVVLGLAYEDTEIEQFDAFLDEFKPSYPILIVDVYAPPEPFGAPKVLPTTIVLDPQGYEVKTFIGPVHGKDIEAVIDKT